MNAPVRVPATYISRALCGELGFLKTAEEGGKVQLREYAGISQVEGFLRGRSNRRALGGAEERKGRIGRCVG